MKKLFYIIPALCALVWSCNKVQDETPEVKPITIQVFVTGDVGTRTTGITDNDPSTEAKINDLQILVFNGNAIDGYGKVTSSNVATVNCTAGSRDVYAVVNGPDLSGVTTKTAMLATQSSLKNNAADFVMIGCNENENLVTNGSSSIEVHRLASRVVLRSIRNNHENDALAADFVIESVYLTNVAGDTDLGVSGNYVVSAWYNRRGYESANNPLGAMNYDAVSVSDGTVAKGATYGTAHYFYSMPNGFAAKTGDVWSPRAAKLLVRIRLGGTLYDYPITLPALESNKSYEINLLTITRNGNQDDGHHDPDDPDDVDEEVNISGVEMSYEISVKNWDVVLVNGGNVSI